MRGVQIVEDLGGEKFLNDAFRLRVLVGAGEGVGSIASITLVLAVELARSHVGFMGCLLTVPLLKRFSYVQVICAFLDT